MRAAVAVVVSLLAACTFPEKHPGEIDGSVVDAPAIDGPAIDGPAIDAPAIDAPAIDAPVDASIDAPMCPVCDSNARCVIEGPNAVCRCNWGYTGNGTTCALAIDNTVAMASDGRTTTIGLETLIHDALYLRNASGVVLSGGEIWFTEGTTVCPGGWDLRTVKFTPGATGPMNVSAVCEGEPDSPVGTTMLVAHTLAGDRRAACFATHPPDPKVRCGSLGASPGTFAQTVDLGFPRDTLYAAASANGFAFATVYVDGAGMSEGVRFARLDANAVQSGSVLPLGPVGGLLLEVGRYASTWSVYRTASNGSIVSDLVNDSGVVTETLSMAALPPAPTTMRRFLVAHSGESSQRFVYAADNQLYFGSIDALGQGTAKKFGGGSLFTGADVIPMFGGYGIVYSTDNTIYYLRVDQNGVVTEPERAIGIDAKVQLIGAVFDGQALWVVYGLAPGTGTESWNVYVRRIA